MSGLRPPPKTEGGSRVVFRLLGLLLLLAVLGVIVWGAVITQRIGQTETLAYEDVELVGPAVIDGVSINVVHDGLGSQPVILLHDFDVAGGVLWDGVVEALGSEVTAVRIDLPGLGLSSRLPDPGPGHTVGSMSAVVGRIVRQRFSGNPVVIAGVGLGGEVAAELAVTQPELVDGLVLIDVDFYRKNGWLETVEGLPFLGRAATFATRGGGPLYDRIWDPQCEQGGWCPSQAQREARALAARIRQTTDSLAAFLRTTPASLVPSRLGDITVPTVYVWSTGGGVPQESVQRAVEALGAVESVEVDAWKAHLEAPDRVAGAIFEVAQ